ncbi:MAG: Uma2 family endonuclease [Anaerolineae bacterium]|nr:MAG: Uma2 family endonuclease [Anaerolineae bacterium]
METKLTGAQMDASVVSAPMTAEELFWLPYDGHRYELIEGELKEMVPAGPRHGRIANAVAFLLTQHARQNDLGVVYAAETGFKLRKDPDTVWAADAAFVAVGRIPPQGEPEGYWDIAPDLVVEVVSPSDSAPAVQSKVTDWLAAGCQLVWVVYPDNADRDRVSLAERHSGADRRAGSGGR